MNYSLCIFLFLFALCTLLLFLGGKSALDFYTIPHCLSSNVNLPEYVCLCVHLLVWIQLLLWPQSGKRGNNALFNWVNSACLNAAFVHSLFSLSHCFLSSL